MAYVYTTRTDEDNKGLSHVGTLGLDIIPAKTLFDREIQDQALSILGTSRHQGVVSDDVKSSQHAAVFRHPSNRSRFPTSELVAGDLTNQVIRPEDNLRAIDNY